MITIIASLNIMVITNIDWLPMCNPIQKTPSRTWKCQDLDQGWLDLVLSWLVQNRSADTRHPSIMVTTVDIHVKHPCPVDVRVLAQDFLVDMRVLAQGLRECSKGSPIVKAFGSKANIIKHFGGFRKAFESSFSVFNCRVFLLKAAQSLRRYTRSCFTGGGYCMSYDLSTYPDPTLLFGYTLMSGHSTLLLVSLALVMNWPD